MNKTIEMDLALFANDWQCQLCGQPTRTGILLRLSRVKELEQIPCCRACYYDSDRVKEYIENRPVG